MAMVVLRTELTEKIHRDFKSIQNSFLCHSTRMCVRYSGIQMYLSAEHGTIISIIYAKNARDRYRDCHIFY